jgi:hypothetical protein
VAVVAVITTQEPLVAQVVVVVETTLVAQMVLLVLLGKVTLEVLDVHTQASVTLVAVVVVKML